MKSLFNKTFFKFAFGFSAIIAVGVVSVFIIGYGFEQSDNQATVENKIEFAE